MSATPLPVSMALAGQTKARLVRNVSTTSRTAQVRIAARICGTLTRNPRPNCPRTWIVMMTAATCSRGSRVFGRTTGYVVRPSVSVRAVTPPSAPQAAIVIARSGARRNGGRWAARLENGRTSGCSPIPSACSMNERRAWTRAQASG